MKRLWTPLAFRRQATPLNPVSNHDALYSDPSGKLFKIDSNGTKTLIDKPPTLQVWNSFGHSYQQFVGGTVYTSGRLDQQFRMMMDVEFTNWRNYAVAGAILIRETRRQGGWVRLMQYTKTPQILGQNIHGAPYWANGGAFLLGWGINDIAQFTSTNQAAVRAAYKHALRAVIARIRCSVCWPNNYVPASGTVGVPTYGAGFTSTASTQEFSASGTLRDATSTTSATITLTLPTDYDGETVVLGFVANAGTAVGGTVTFSGTAGVTGTLSLSNIVPALTNPTVAQTPVAKRVTGLTAANAGQTIVITVTSLDAGGRVRFDYWGLEAKNPNPVIVMNTARVLNYAGYPDPDVGDTEVGLLNADIASVVAEFDGMVQVADIDSALNKDTKNFASDGLHPNEFGAGKAANAIINAVDALIPNDSTWPQASVTPSAPVAGAMRRPHPAGNYYGPLWISDLVVSSNQPVTGTLYASPFVVTEQREIYVEWAISQVTAGTANSTIWFGIYDDPEWSGYPQNLLPYWVGNGSLVTANTTGKKTQTGHYWMLDPGLWWLAVKFGPLGTGQQFQTVRGPEDDAIMPRLDASMNFILNTIAWTLTGQGNSVLPDVFPSGATVGGLWPNVGIMRG